MTGIGNDDQLRLGPGLVQVPRREHRTDDVIAPLHDDAGDPPDPTDVVEELALLSEKPAVHEVVRLDAREGLGEAALLELLDTVRIDLDLARRRLPDRPGT